MRLYLREMGSVPLLDREGEIEIARRIERGQMKTRRTLSRCPIIVQAIVRLGDQVSSGQLAARDILQFNDPIPTDETYETGAAELASSCAEMERLRKKFMQLRQRLVAVPRQTKPKQNRRLRWELGRLAVQISRNVCSIRLHKLRDSGFNRTIARRSR